MADIKNLEKKNAAPKIVLSHLTNITSLSKKEQCNYTGLLPET